MAKKMKLNSESALLMFKILSPYVTYLRVEDFPELRKYERVLRGLPRQMLFFQDDEEEGVAFPQIIELDRWWARVFPLIGFAYNAERREFFFGDFYPEQDEKPVDRIIIFLKELKKHGYL